VKVPVAAERDELVDRAGFLSPSSRMCAFTSSQSLFRIDGNRRPIPAMQSTGARFGEIEVRRR